MRWHSLWHGCLAALSLVTAGTTLGDYVGQRVAGLMALVAGALQAGTAGYYGWQQKTVVSAPTLVVPPGRDP